MTYNDIKIPNTVKDKDAYLRYLKIKDADSIKRENRLIHTSDSKTIIDPLSYFPKIQKQVADLPKKEKDQVMKRVRAIKVITMKINSLKIKAFGLSKPNHHPDLQQGLLDERQSELIEYYGRMLSDKEVHKIITLEWGYDIGMATLKNFRSTHKNKIEKLKHQFQTEFDDIRLSHKKGRLEEMVWMYNDRKVKYETSKSQQDYRLLLSTLKQIKDEVEDPSLKIEHNINAKLEVTVNNHIQKELMKGLSINDIIIARVAARMDVNPRFLISRLHKSIYSKHSGFIRPDKDLKDQEIVYPSTMVYNWDEIKKQHKDGNVKDIEEAEWEDVSKSKQMTAQQIKQRMLDKIINKKDDLNQAKSRVDKNTTK